LRRITVAVVGLVCAVISLAEGSVCVASAFTIATRKHIGDCDKNMLEFAEDNFNDAGIEVRTTCSC